jgi:hypothetical protein
MLSAQENSPAGGVGGSGAARDVAMAVRGLRGDLESPMEEDEGARGRLQSQGHSRNWSTGPGSEHEGLGGPASGGGWDSPAASATSAAETERVRSNGVVNGGNPTAAAAISTPENAASRLASYKYGASTSTSSFASGTGSDRTASVGRNGTGSEPRTRQFRGHVSAMSGGSTGSQEGLALGSGSGSGSGLALGMGPGPSHTLSRITKALERSADEGDTLDLSRRGIARIEEEDVDMFRCGVGKEKKGVWR